MIFQTSKSHMLTNILPINIPYKIACLKFLYTIYTPQKSKSPYCACIK